METLIDLAPANNEDKNVSSFPIVNSLNTHTVQDRNTVLSDQVNKDNITSYEQPNKPLLMDKLKMTANHKTKSPYLQPAKRPASSNTSTSLLSSLKPLQSSSPLTTMKPPGPNTLDPTI